MLKPFFRLRIIPAEADESPRRSEAPSKYVVRVAREKWEIVSRRIGRPQIVLAADTIVVLDGKILGKPGSLAGAKKMLQKLSAQTHEVLTAVSVGWSDRRYPGFQKTVRTKVGFREISEEELRVYLAGREWEGKAGGYAIQGGALAFVAEIEGSLTNVIGLPLKETLDLIAKCFAWSKAS